MALPILVSVAIGSSLHVVALLAPVARVVAPVAHVVVVARWHVAPDTAPVELLLLLRLGEREENMVRGTVTSEIQCTVLVIIKLT